MEVIHHTAGLNAGGKPACLAIGVFDGVHLGHQKVIQSAVSDAARCRGVSSVITFDRHPAAVLAPAQVPPQIYLASQKLRAINSLGVDRVCVIHFDKEFSQISGEEFVRSLARDCGKLHSLAVGSTFVFGRGRSGNVDLLKGIGNEIGFAVHPISEVSLDGDAVSSTRVREAVSAGQLELAGRMLGRPYVLCSDVVKGAGLGRKLGVPTANLNVTGLLIPPNGVYAALAMVQGRSIPAAVNIGTRPTAGDSEPTVHVEAHLLDFSGDVYGQELALSFVKKLREEKKFPDLDALRAQIQNDIAQTRQVVPAK